MPSENYKLNYFTLRGLAEPIRFVLAYRGINYEDNRVEFEDWPALKPTAPFGKLPSLEVDGVSVPQSAAITRYLGKKGGLGGANEWEDLHIDSAVDCVRDLLQEFTNSVREKNPEEKKIKEETFRNESWPFYLEKFDSLIKANGGYVANKKLSWGDLYIIAVLEFLQSKLNLDISKFTHFKALNDKILNLPSIKAWVAKRPEDRWGKIPAK